MEMMSKKHHETSINFTIKKREQPRKVTIITGIKGEYEDRSFIPITRD
jgi:hypothetical protein